MSDNLYFSSLTILRNEGGLFQADSSTGWLERKDATKRIIEDILGGIPNVYCQIQWRVDYEEEMDEYIKRKVIYSWGEEEEIPAYLLVPKGITSPRPAVIAIHGTTPYGKDVVIGIRGPNSRHYGFELVKRGYVVLAPDLLTFGERLHGGLRYVDTTDFYRRYPNWSMSGKMIFDISRSIDFLYTQSIVDKFRIGAIGHSLGGHNAFFAAAFDGRITTAVSSCGTYPFVDLSQAFSWARRDPRNFIYIPRLRDYLICNKPAPFDLHEVMALIAPRPFLNISADEGIPKMGDMLNDMHQNLLKVYKLYNAEERLGWHFYDGPHDFPTESREIAYAWLDRWLLVK